MARLPHGAPPVAPRAPPLPALEAEIAIEWTRVVGILAIAFTLINGELPERHHIHWLPEAAVGVPMWLMTTGLPGCFAISAAALMYCGGLSWQSKLKPTASSLA